MDSGNTFTIYKYESLDALPLRYKSNQGCLGSTPLRLARLCCLGILLPILCIVIPVYARYVLYAETSLVLSASDMRVLDSHISTAWCQKQVLRTNRSFDAYLLEDKPVIAPQAQVISMIRNFEIDDDLKEYWGFYLLRGTEITVSSCARYLGANVMLIKGRGGLRYCAYVGEESTEDNDSVEEDVELKKMEMQYRQNTNNVEKFKAPPPPMFKQHSKTEQSRILELLKSRNEKRKLIKLLEKQTHLQNTNDSMIDSSSQTILRKVDNALRKMLEKEIQSLYQEIKSILHGQRSSKPKNRVAAMLEERLVRNKSRGVEVPAMGDPENIREFLESEFEEDENAAFEVDDSVSDFNATSDGIAEDRGTIDHRHVNDTSESDESSFSSSEEAMLHCRGVLISHPLIPDSQCSIQSDPTQNVVRYSVDEDGYYYFIFSSANEKVPNKITVKFELQKTVYNTSTATSTCANSTVCEFPLSFASNELVVLSMPVPDSSYSKLWDESFIVESACEPRMPLYLAFCLALPVLILLCGLR